MHLLVTGGTGFLGGALLAAAVRDADLDVTATWHRTPLAEPGERVRWMQVDLRSPDQTAQTLDGTRPAVVIHTAVAIGPEQLGPVIVQGSAHAARAAHDAGAAFIHLSSDMVFDGASGPFDEASPLSPITDYGRAKAEAEEAVRAAHPDAIIARASLLYRLSPPDRALAHWLDGARRGAGHPLFVDEIRCPAHVDDVAGALLALAHRLGRPEGADLPRTLHLVGPTALSRHAFGVLVLDALGLDRTLAVPGWSADSGLVRPRVLHLLRTSTPEWLVAGLRAPQAVLAAPA